MIDDQAADGWADHARNAPDTAKKALDASTFSQFEDVANDRQHQRQHSASSQPLQSAEKNELFHCLRGARGHGTKKKEGDPKKKNQLATIEVGQFAVNRDGSGRSEEH